MEKKQQSLFGGQTGGSGAGLKINKNYEEKFNHRKQREHTEKIKQRYGEQVLYDNQDEVDSSLSEDDDAKFADNAEMIEFLNTISKIKTKNPEIYDKKKQFFSSKVDEKAIEQEYEEEINAPKKKAFTLKDAMIQQANGFDIESSEDEETKAKPRKETKFEEEKRLKSQFLQAGEELDSGDLLHKKVKSKHLVEDPLTLIEKSKGSLKDKEVDTLTKIWSKSAPADENEQFLRDYILKRKWMDDNGDSFRGSRPKVDDEDDEIEEKNDFFEAKHNFRFEEAGASQIINYSREQPDSLRVQENSRKNQRDAKKQREEEKKKNMVKDIEMARQGKISDLKAKLLRLKQVSGVDISNYEELLQEALQGDFKTYDRIMEKIFNEEYYQQEEKNEDEMQRYMENVEKELDHEFLPKEEGAKPEEEDPELKQEKDEGIFPRPNIPVLMKHAINEEEVKGMGLGLWYYCDVCLVGIKPLEPRFDCMTCSDHTECKKCADLQTHEHKLKKFIVPESCVPPSNEEIKEILGRFYNCRDCGAKLSDSTGYYFSKKEAEVHICNDCIGFISGNEKLRDFGQKQAEKANQGISDELFGVDYEDIIAGGIKARYQYMEVEKEDGGLTDAELFYADPKLLNQMLSIKKLAPYKTNQITQKDRDRMRKFRTLVRESAEKNQKEFLQELQLKEQEEELKERSKKNKKSEKEYNKFLESKDEQLRSIRDGPLNKRSIRVEKDVDEKPDEAKEKRVKEITASIPKERLAAYGFDKRK